jgi:hypothetical protein
VSSLRLPDARVAHREHEHVFIIRPCERCGQPLQQCRGCEPGRRYCLSCSPLACRERGRRAHKTYYGSVDGRRQHHREEHERRKRRRREARRQGFEGGRDRRCTGLEGRLQVISAASRVAAEEPSDEERAGERQGVEETSAVDAWTPGKAHRGASREVGSVEWTVVAWPGFLAAARRVLGTEVACPFCGRRGVVRRVLALDQWRCLGGARGQRWKRPP